MESRMAFKGWGLLLPPAHHDSAQWDDAPQVVNCYALTLAGLEALPHCSWLQAQSSLRQQ